VLRARIPSEKEKAWFYRTRKSPLGKAGRKRLGLYAKAPEEPFTKIKIVPMKK
jgi:hypothetical protein